ncbi:hypothetical protein SAMN05216262_101539 [Colwellia chukchiensis]|uniref:Uncharacterized protein n=1 Tax=Colwellia chukchiensis TaxID=641665 RepID=A0A1H7HLQ8_9GAMM|nr:hypothetical protein [Colwellia chukchiensis]SEK51244.1 hypothetical protein SAMN05216262_101539 [Colwellia chukchiensis]
MSNKEQLAQEQAFADWLDGKSDDSQINAEPEWQQRKNTVNTLKEHVAMTADADVPSWDRGRAFVGNKVPFWSWRGLPALSMAFSVFALVLVLFKVELVVHEQGLLLSFAGSSTQVTDDKLAKLVDAKLQGFAQRQERILASYAAEIKEKQQASNLELASYILSASRQERQEDISDFMHYITAQRQDELLEQNLKFQALEQAIKYNQAYQRQNVTGFGLNHGDVNRTPANWTAEE